MGDSGIIIYTDSVLLSIPQINNLVTSGYELSQNYPNPFNPVTSINYELPSSHFVSLKVFDLLGKEIATLFEGKINAGKHSVKWNAAEFPGGIYFYRLTIDRNVTDTRKMVLLK